MFSSNRPRSLPTTKGCERAERSSARGLILAHGPFGLVLRRAIDQVELKFFFHDQLMGKAYELVSLELVDQPVF